MLRRGDIAPACFLHTAHGSHATSSPASEAHGATWQDVTHMFIPRRANTAGLCWVMMWIMLSRYTTGGVRAASRGGRGGVKGKQPKRKNETTRLTPSCLKPRLGLNLTQRENRPCFLERVVCQKIIPIGFIFVKLNLTQLQETCP